MANLCTLDFTKMAFGSAKCNLIRLGGGSDGDTAAWFSSVSYVVPHNQIRTAPPQALSHYAAAAVFGFLFLQLNKSRESRSPCCPPAWSDFLIIYVSIHGNKHLLFLCVQTINSTDPVLINRLPVWILWMTLLDSLLFPLKNKRFLSPKLWLTGFVVTFVKWLVLSNAS